MNNDELIEKLKELKAEELIWIIYIGIIFLSFYSNDLEKKYFIYNDLESKKRYRKIMILIFSILVIVYLYFLKEAFDDIKNINSYDSNEENNLLYLSFIGSLLIAVSGFIFLYIAVRDESLAVEIAFN